MHWRMMLSLPTQPVPGGDFSCPAIFETHVRTPEIRRIQISGAIAYYISQRSLTIHYPKPPEPKPCSIAVLPEPRVLERSGRSWSADGCSDPFALERAAVTVDSTTRSVWRVVIVLDCHEIGGLQDWESWLKHYGQSHRRSHRSTPQEDIVSFLLRRA